MKSSLTTIDSGFYAVLTTRNGKSLTAYYSLGRLVAVQVKEVLYLSENYWLDASAGHIKILRGMRGVYVTECAADVLADNYGFYLKELVA